MTVAKYAASIGTGYELACLPCLNLVEGADVLGNLGIDSCKGHGHWETRLGFSQ